MATARQRGIAAARQRGLDAVDMLADVGVRSRATLADRLRRVRRNLLFAVQAAFAAGAAWLVAFDVLHHARPFFAPIAAVIVLNVSMGQRLRRAVELVLGVALGILVGDVLIYFIGTGAWQIGAGVAVAILASVFLGGGPLVIGQAASSAVLVATLAPPSSGIYYTRFLDALVGGVVGVLVLAVLLPVNPLTIIRKAAGPAISAIADGLRDCADAMAARDRQRADAALARLRSGEAAVIALRDALSGARESATLAPVWWRSRAPLTRWVEAASHLDHAVRNGRVLARRTVAMLRDAEAVPDELPDTVGRLTDAIESLGRELGMGIEPRGTRQRALDVIRQAADIYRVGTDFSAGVIVAQIRMIGTDLLLATGLPRPVVERAVRRAVGRLPSGTGQRGPGR